MAVDRRSFLKFGAATVGVSLLGFNETNAEANDEFADNYAMLNDSTLCIGCRGCQSACKEAHELPHTGHDKRYEMPTDLNAQNLTLIQLQRKSEDEYTFIRRSCLHCNVPSCVSVCPVAAFTKRADGVVAYDKDKCIGCRYCQVACPFDAPTFEYNSATPVVVKCDFCKDLRLKNNETPVCASICPRKAIKFGTRKELLREAHKRIKDNPGRYNTHVYGETEIGGTSVMFLAPAGFTFEELGYRKWGETPPGQMQEEIQHGIFKYWIPPVALYGALGLAAYTLGKKNSNKSDDSGEVKNES
ncbi:MAG: hydrogenase 2 operon protein HybA [Melioribacteraceae bacterium]|nr:hydrogenase 2 operon protein HybA [Melioribacteraceae bacterium]MCF8265453.1 hydrogenase 2 operon protein HybA [Melioribacteraceae bacterium]